MTKSRYTVKIIVIIQNSIEMKEKDIGELEYRVGCQRRMGKRYDDCGKNKEKKDFKA